MENKYLEKVAEIVKEAGGYSSFLKSTMSTKRLNEIKGLGFSEKRNILGITKNTLNSAPQVGHKLNNPDHSLSMAAQLKNRALRKAEEYDANPIAYAGRTYFGDSDVHRGRFVKDWNKGKVNSD